MESKTQNVYARIEPSVKKQAEEILSTLGISTSSAINIFYKQIILQNGLPFEVKIPRKKPVFINELSEEELIYELEKGIKDMEENRVKEASEVFTSIRKDYNI